MESKRKKNKRQSMSGADDSTTKDSANISTSDANSLDKNPTEPNLAVELPSLAETETTCTELATPSTSNVKTSTKRKKRKKTKRSKVPVVEVDMESEREKNKSQSMSGADDSTTKDSANISTSDGNLLDKNPTEPNLAVELPLLAETETTCTELANPSTSNVKTSTKRKKRKKTKKSSKVPVVEVDMESEREKNKSQSMSGADDSTTKDSANISTSDGNLLDKNPTEPNLAVELPVLAETETTSQLSGDMSKFVSGLKPKITVEDDASHTSSPMSESGKDDDNRNDSVNGQPPYFIDSSLTTLISTQDSSSSPMVSELPVDTSATLSAQSDIDDTQDSYSIMPSDCDEPGLEGASQGFDDLAKDFEEVSLGDASITKDSANISTNDANLLDKNPTEPKLVVELPVLAETETTSKLSSDTSKFVSSLKPKTTVDDDAPDTSSPMSESAKNDEYNILASDSDEPNFEPVSQGVVDLASGKNDEYNILASDSDEPNFEGAPQGVGDLAKNSRKVSFKDDSITKGSANISISDSNLPDKNPTEPNLAVELPLLAETETTSKLSGDMSKFVSSLKPKTTVNDDAPHTSSPMSESAKNDQCNILPSDSDEPDFEEVPQGVDDHASGKNDKILASDSDEPNFEEAPQGVDDFAKKLQEASVYNYESDDYDS